MPKSEKYTIETVRINFESHYSNVFLSGVLQYGEEKFKQMTIEAATAIWNALVKCVIDRNEPSSLATIVGLEYALAKLMTEFLNTCESSPLPDPRNPERN